MQNMNKELDRLATFANWPLSSSAWPSQLARYGLYATGEGDTTICFSCCTSLAQWQLGDDPKQKHQRLAPHCSVVNGHSSTNVPLTPLRDDFDRNVTSGSFHQDGSVPRTSGDVRDSSSSELPVPSIYQVGRSALDRAKQKGVLVSAQPAPAVDPENPDFGLLRHEAARLATFTNFPTNSPVTPSALAKAGFFYKGPRDRVQCAFCRQHLRNWVPGDDPMSEHRRHMPNCPFVNGVAHGNVRIEDEEYTDGTHTTDSPSAPQDPQVSACVTRVFVF